MRMNQQKEMRTIRLNQDREAREKQLKRYCSQKQMRLVLWRSEGEQKNQEDLQEFGQTELEKLRVFKERQENKLKQIQQREEQSLINFQQAQLKKLKLYQQKQIEKIRRYQKREIQKIKSLKKGSITQIRNYVASLQRELSGMVKQKLINIKEIISYRRAKIQKYRTHLHKLTMHKQREIKIIMEDKIRARQNLAKYRKEAGYVHFATYEDQLSRQDSTFVLNNNSTSQQFSLSDEEENYTASSLSVFEIFQVNKSPPARRDGFLSAKAYLRREKTQQNESPLKNQYNGYIRSIFQREKKEQYCSICTQVVLKGQVINRLPCYHLFHQNCLQNWFSFRAACPNCRNNVELN